MPRNSGALADAAFQSRLLTLPRLRPLAWCHARDGVLVADGSGKISSIETGRPYKFQQSTASLRPSRGVFGETQTLQFDSSTNAIGSGSISPAIIWESFTLGMVLYTVASVGLILRDIFATELGAIRYDSANARITGGITGAGNFAIHGVSANQPATAVLTYNYSSQSGWFRCGTTSTSVTWATASEEATFALEANSSAVPQVVEAVVFDRWMPDSELVTLQGVLAWSSNLPQTLPASHPYRNRPPLIGD